jgi:transcriptional regulator with XRE-family HTH domain
MESNKEWLNSGAKMAISAAQCRAARGLLNWSREELALASNVALRTIVDFEREARAPRATTLKALQTGLEQAGVAFLPDHGKGAGLRFKPRLSAAHMNSGDM